MRKYVVAFLCSVLLSAAAANADEILIVDDNFGKFLKDAKPGDVFAVYPGLYRLPSTTLLAANGTESAPITIRPSTAGKVTIEVIRPIGLKISGSYWNIEGLEFVGVCEKDSECEHAIQIVGDADHITLKNNRLIDFNAAIKGNGYIKDDVQQFPDHVTIEDNYIYNRRPRETGNPVTPIDVVGGKYWEIKHNFIADFAKAGGNQISYAAFLKGNSDHGLFERNLVICEWRTSGGIRVGLSFGGGGTKNPKFCQGRSCTIQHYKGVMRSNIILNCPNDVGVYLNSAANTELINNTILNTAGVDVRFTGSFATLANNIIEGRVKERDGGRFREVNNVVERDLDDFYPNLGSYDLSPEDPEDLMRAADEFPGVDFCSGKSQSRWLGAMAQPAQCSIPEILSKIVSQE